MIVAMGKMAVSRVTSTYQYTVSAFLKSFQDKHGAYSAGTGKTDNTHIRRIFQSTRSRKVSTGIRAVGADKRNDFRFKGFTHQRTPEAKFGSFTIKLSSSESHHFSKDLFFGKACQVDTVRAAEGDTGAAALTQAGINRRHTFDDPSGTVENIFLFNGVVQ